MLTLGFLEARQLRTCGCEIDERSRPAARRDAAFRLRGASPARCDDKAQARQRAGQEAAAREQPSVLEGVQGLRGVGLPMIAIRIATPSAAPTCRATEFNEVATAKRGPGTEPTAAPLSVGKVSPAPTPRITIPGSHPPRKSG